MNTDGITQPLMASSLSFLSLMSSPILPRITLRTPPPSPGPSHITLTSIELDDSYGPIVSPVKVQTSGRTRTSGTRRPRKKAKANEGDYMAVRNPMEQQSGGWSGQDHMYEPVGQAENLDSGLDQQQMDWDEPDGRETNENKGYLEYVDSVLEDGTAFFQITTNLFVVNGWDAKTKRSKVLISLFEKSDF